MLGDYQSNTQLLTMDAKAACTVFDSQTLS